MDRNSANDLFRRELVRRGLISDDQLESAVAAVESGAAKDLVHAVVESGLIEAEEAKAILRTVLTAVKAGKGKDVGRPAAGANAPKKENGKGDGGVKAKARKPKVVHSDLTGQLLGNRYRVKSLIGSGGMGAVWLADDEKEGKPVAVKVLPKTLTHDEQYRGRFLREARAAAKLQGHPNICSVTFCDHEKQFDLLYMVMQYVDGFSLQEWVDKDLEGPVPEDHALPVIRQVLDALGTAHSIGIVHRDIKPDNILIERDSFRPWIVDFGLARFEQQASNLTAQGQVMGTPHFMAPEQCEGKVVDGRADLYAAGCVFYYMLTHRYPFTGETTTAIIIAQLRKNAQPMSSYGVPISDTLEAVIAKLLAKKPEQRYQTAADALADLEELGGDGSDSRGGLMVTTVDTTAPDVARVQAEAEAAAVADAQAAPVHEEAEPAAPTQAKPPARQAASLDPGRATMKPAGPRSGRQRAAASEPADAPPAAEPPSAASAGSRDRMSVSPLMRQKANRRPAVRTRRDGDDNRNAAASRQLMIGVISALVVVIIIAIIIAVVL